MAKHTCIICGASAESDFCFQHKPKKALKKVKITDITTAMEKIEEIEKQWNFFKKIWNKRPHKSEVSGTPIWGEPLTVYFHHILPKEKYPEAKYDEENIIILTLLEHDSVGNNSYLYDIINERRGKLLEKYG